MPRSAKTVNLSLGHQSRKNANIRRGSARQRGYTRRWDVARAIFIAKNPICASCLNNRNKMIPARVVDHIIPHRGNEELFWDESNWQSLCITCHNIKSGQERVV